MKLKKKLNCKKGLKKVISYPVLTFQTHDLGFEIGITP
jgi:hypothetical protein